MGPMPGVMTDGKSKKKNLTKKTGAGVLGGAMMPPAAAGGAGLASPMPPKKGR